MPPKTEAKAKPKATSGGGGGGGGDMMSDPGWQFLRLSSDQIVKDQSKKIDTKKNVWIASKEDGYVMAEVTATKGDSVTVKELASGTVPQSHR